MKGGIIFTDDNSSLAGEGFPPDLILLQDTGIVHLVTEKCLEISFALLHSCLSHPFSSLHA